MLTRIHFILLMAAIITLPMPAYPVPKVAATINPVHFLVSAVGSGIMAPTLSSTGSSCLHDCILRPSDVAQLSSADIVFYLDERLEPFIKKLNKDNTKKLIRLSDEVDLLADRNVSHRRDADRIKDFHIWLSPENARRIVRKVCDTLSDVDPDNAGVYRSNTHAMLTRIGVLENRIRDTLASVRDRPYIVVHDAYQYFDRYFGLNFVASLSPGHSTSITARELSATKKAAAQQNVKCILADVGHAKKGYKLMSKNIKIHTIDPLGMNITDPVDGYFELMLSLAQSFKKCLLDES